MGNNQDRKDGQHIEQEGWEAKSIGRIVSKYDRRGLEANMIERMGMDQKRKDGKQIGYD